MTVRPAEAGDARAIAALWNAMIRDTLATFTTQERTDAEVADLIRARQGAFWCLGDASGFVTFGPFRAGPGYAATVEHTVILAGDAQGRGQGRVLMSHAMKAASEQGIHVMVAAISSANPAAVGFHQSLGFARSGLMPQVGRKAGRWLDLVLMQKTL